MDVLSVNLMCVASSHHPRLRLSTSTVAMLTRPVIGRPQSSHFLLFQISLQWQDNKMGLLLLQNCCKINMMLKTHKKTEHRGEN
jgi:hypothetical protein